MNPSKTLKSIIPTPRRRVTIRQSLSLIVFLAFYALLCLWLPWSGRMTFVRPAMFSLMLSTVWVWWLHVAGYGGMGRIRGEIALLIRLAFVGAFVMLLAEPRAVRSNDTLSVVYTLDVSDSIGERSTDAALGFVTRTVSAKPPKDEAGLIVFGRDASVELPPRMSFPFEMINSRIDREATNLEQALSLSAAMLPAQTKGRIVLISDGTMTEGNLSRILSEVKSRDIAVDVLPIQYEYDHEVWVERLELPGFVKVGENYEAAVVVSSLKDGSGRLVVDENGRTVYDQPYDFRAGKNRKTLPIQLREPGYYEYTASIVVPRTKDRLRQNNRASNALFVEGEGKVLLVTDSNGDKRDWDSLNLALKESERLVEVKSSLDFPRDALSLMPYDAIVFVNVPADAFDAVQLKALRDAVYDIGVGFLMVGGANSFGPGGYHRTYVEEVLPVSMDVSNKKILPKGALVIVLHTCEFAEGNTWGKRITKQAIKVLGDQDEVGVLAYTWDGQDQWIFKLTPAGEYEKLVPLINAAEIGDMPGFGPTMQMGLTALKESNASARHMIVISDGDPSPPPPNLLKQFRDNQISISTVSINPHGGLEIQLMQRIAALTGGRYYTPKRASELPAIFIKESKTLRRNMIQNKTIKPEAGFPSAIMKGIDAVPPLHGYVLTTVKNRSEAVLNAPIEEGEEQVDPILATWQFGLGRTAAFTSDLSTNWGADWVQWSQYRAFVKQLIISVSRVQKKSHLRMASYMSSGRAVIVVDDFHPDDSPLQLQARITGPREQTKTVALQRIAPRQYRASVPLWGRGRYHVMALGSAGERTDRAHGGFTVPYSPEYLRFRSNPIVLKEIAERTDGRLLTAASTADDIYSVDREPKRSSRPIFDWFLIALACLLPLDVAVRRIQIDFKAILGRFRLRARSEESTATLAATLKRKKEVESTLDKGSSTTTVNVPPATTSFKQASRQTAPPPPPPTPSVERSKPAESTPDVEPSPGDKSTMSRLLAKKRQRQEDQDD